MQRRSILGAATALAGACAASFASVPLLGSFLPSARARALGGPVAVNIADLRPGQVKPVVYRGHTMLVLKRTREMISGLRAMRDREIDVSVGADPLYTDSETRSIVPDILVVEGVCTHLGCVPRLLNTEQGREMFGDWWAGGFRCPCHDSAYDYAGRVVKGPAPANLRIPPHRYDSPTKIVIGEDTVVT